MRSAVPILCAFLMASCADSGVVENAVNTEGQNIGPPYASPRTRTVRLTGTLEAVRSTRIVVPELSGRNVRVTLTRIIPNGTRVEVGDVLALFDPVEQLDLARQSAAQYEDLSHQVREKEADNVASAEGRRSELEQAEADLAKALLEVSKAEILPEIDAEQNAIRAEKAAAQVESLRRKHPDEARIDRAALRVLELRRDRQLAAFERADANLEKLEIRAPLAGMAVLATRSSGGSMIRPQEGDQMNRNNALLSIFDPGEMLVRTSVAEPDGALLEEGLEATVYVDAYPDLALKASFVTASPVASTSLGIPVKTFMALFRVEESDPRLTPDLSAAVVFEVHEASGPMRGQP